MKTGDLVTIKNKAGILRLIIEKELSMRNVAMGLGDDKIPPMERPRLEYHKGTGYSGHLITLCDERDQLPFHMYLLHLDDCEDKPKCYLAFVNDSESDVFETVY